jgi:molecular chaperone DnaK
MPHIVGIDLGTTHSLVATMERERPVIIPNRQGKRLTPSVVGLDRSDKLHVGETARNQLTAMPERTVAEVKRLMGSGEKVRLGPREYSPTEISGLILTALKEDAERHFGGRVEEAVITVPAYFTDAQRQATKDAGELAGLRVERILNEPTAAALAYGLDHLDKEQFVLVYDLGGGTFDVSVLEMFQGVLDVKASAGNNRLGGGDFDRAIAAWLAEQFEKMHGVSLAGNLSAQVRLKAAAEAAKIDLSSADAVPVMVPFLAAGPGGSPLSLEVELTRAKLEDLIGALVRSTLGPIEAAMRDAKVAKEGVTDVVLVGGSSRLPLVQRLVAEYFGKEPRRGVHPDEAIALGAAVQAGLKSGGISPNRGIMITDVAPFTLGVEVMAHAGGERLSGMFSPIIPRNTTVPVSRTEVYATTSDGQRAVDIKVYQGESRMVRHNIFLDQYTVEGLPPAPAGAEKIGITFTYDVNGILNVKTKVMSTGKEAALVIDKSAQRMTPQEREQARERLEREWAPGATPGAAAAPAPASAAPPAPAGATATPAASASVKALISAAHEKLATLEGDKRVKLASLVDQLKAAVVRNDATEVARLDAALTDFLFELV